jgi:hypothetical protein
MIKIQISDPDDLGMQKNELMKNMYQTKILNNNSIEFGEVSCSESADFYGNSDVSEKITAKFHTVEIPWAPWLFAV